MAPGYDADVHAAAEALRRASLSQDSPTAGAGRTPAATPLLTSQAERRIRELKSEQRKANAEAPRRATSGLFRAICSTDLLFLIDTTGSMGSYIEAAKNQIRSIVNDIGIAFLNEAEVRMAVVGYKDHSDSPNIQFLDFTTSSSQVRSFLDTLSATGGADAPEDVLGGIWRALNANWRHRTRCIIHIADAPPHGRDLHDLGVRADYYPNPGSEPHGLTYKPLLSRMVNLHINYVLLQINGCTDRMAFAFLETYAAASADCTLLPTNAYYARAVAVSPKQGAITGGLLFQEARLGVSFNVLRRLVVNAVTASASRTAVRHVPHLSKTGTKLGAIGEEEEDDGPLPDEPLEAGGPQWETPGWLNETLVVVGFTADVLVHGTHTLNDMMASDDNITVSELELTINKRQHPFAQGSLRLASYAGTAASTNRYVVKSFKRPGSRLPQLAEDMQCQALCKSFALEFNALLGGEHAIDFIVTACLKGESESTADDACISLEPFLEGDYSKYNNNSGGVHGRTDDPTNQAAQAFSHFTYERSQGRFLVCDLQGVGELLTDPAVHTLDPDRFNLSSTNLGEEGFKFFFASHDCNAICRKLALRSNDTTLRSGQHQFRESWPSLADTVCCSNKLCGRILLRTDASKSKKYPGHHWCDVCWPQLDEFKETRVCAVPAPARRHTFEVSRFYYESQGRSTPNTCSQHREYDDAGTTTADKSSDEDGAAARGPEMTGTMEAVPIAMVTEGGFWDNLRSASVTLDYED
ncbi:MHCK/EF2 kinase [Niveomyces insectorum RCEF 264]|uniref:MHCK/EF2 kinase n=1 Tax=Niveomyces insectorum RCEF 264 TaxID=1081102 RepID=A0A167QGJ7_9HYPO|nr:MHCK/EF2 kinase [Niveomyces insectorum RCEF 264]